MRLVWAALIAAVLVSCGGPQASPGLNIDESRDRRAEFTDQLVAISARHDAAALAQLLAGQPTYGGMWFSDAHCRGMFAGTGPVAEEAAASLAACIAPLTLAKSADRTHAYPNVAVLTYDPGIEIELMFDLDSGRIRWIGYSGRRRNEALPAITQAAFEALRVDQTPWSLDAATAEALEREAKPHPSTPPGPPVVLAWLRVCIDATGAITGVHPYGASSRRARDAFVSIVQSWQLKPFVADGQATPVCSLIAVDHPAHAVKSSSFPFPVPADHSDDLEVPFWELGKLTSGSKLIVPDDSDKKTFHARGLGKMTAEVTYCVDRDGRVDWVALTQRTAFPVYNKRLIDGVSAWRFEPQGEPLCTRSLFVYSQRG